MADFSHEISNLFFRKSGKMSQTWSSAAVVMGALRVNSQTRQSQEKVVCFCRLLKCFRNFLVKQCRPRSNCSCRSSLIRVHNVCLCTNIRHTISKYSKQTTKQTLFPTAAFLVIFLSEPSHPNNALRGFKAFWNFVITLVYEPFIEINCNWSLGLNQAKLLIRVRS